MHALAESLKGGGAFAYLMILVGGASVTLCLAGLAASFSSRSARTSPIFSVLMFASALAIAGLAFLQRSVTLSAIRRSVFAVAVDQRHLLVVKGVSEIAPTMALGLVLLCLPMVVGAFLMARGAHAQPEANATRSRSVVVLLAPLSAVGFNLGIYGYATVLMALQAFGSSAERAGEMVTVSGQMSAALVALGIFPVSLAALLCSTTYRRRANRMTSATTLATFIIGLAFAGLGQAFAIDVDKEFGRAARPMIVVPPGLQLPTTSARTTPGAPGLVVIGVDAIFVDGVKVDAGKPLEAALKQTPLVELNGTMMPLLADKRATFSKLSAVLDAAELAGHHRFELIAEPGPGYRAMTFRDRSLQPPPGRQPQLALTVKLGAANFVITASGGALEPEPLDFGHLNQRLIEIRTNFPDERTVTIAPAADVSIETLWRACEAAKSKGDQLLFDDLVIDFPRRE